MTTPHALYQVEEWNTVLKSWLSAAISTESEQEARESLDYFRRMYPQRKFRLVEIRRVVSVIEGEGD